MTPWNSHTVGGGIKSAIFFYMYEEKKYRDTQRERKKNKQKKKRTINKFIFTI